MVSESRAAGLCQPKTGRGAGQSPAIKPQREALGASVSAKGEAVAHVVPATDKPDDFDITSVIRFFEILDRWDREAHGPQTM